MTTTLAGYWWLLIGIATFGLLLGMGIWRGKKSTDLPDALVASNNAVLIKLYQQANQLTDYQVIARKNHLLVKQSLKDIAILKIDKNSKKQLRYLDGLPVISFAQVVTKEEILQTLTHALKHN